MKIKIMNIVGARPNFMKIAPIISEMNKHAEFELKLLHTGQHYDDEMSSFFFEDLQIPEPDIYLGVDSGNHGEQTGKIMIEFLRKFYWTKNLIWYLGDVNSTIACGLVAVKLGVKFAHVEAGLRSFDRTMPEEINRLLTDQISDFLFITEKSAEDNLLKEGISRDKIHFVGNVMIDSLLGNLDRAQNSKIFTDLDLQPREFVLLTLHRPSNVDTRENFLEILTALQEIQKEIIVVFPVHPRSKKRLSEFGLNKKLKDMPNFLVQEPLGYLDFLKLMSEAKLVLTDSGGIQEETTVLGIPCLTLRENTERPVTVLQGTNEVIGVNAKRLVTESRKILNGTFKKGKRPDLWDGNAAKRLVDVLVESFKT